jgi:hypothetical protein
MYNPSFNSFDLLFTFGFRTPEESNPRIEPSVHHKTPTDDTQQLNDGTAASPSEQGSDPRNWRSIRLEILQDIRPVTSFAADVYLCK